MVVVSQGGEMGDLGGYKVVVAVSQGSRLWCSQGGEMGGEEEG